MPRFVAFLIVLVSCPVPGGDTDKLCRTSYSCAPRNDRVQVGYVNRSRLYTLFRYLPLQPSQR
jgi:hypothetical protein